MIMKNLLKYIIPSLFVGALMGWWISSFVLTNQENPEPVQGKDESEASIYTCSMHPQIRQAETGLCPICEMDLIPLEENTSNDPLVLEMTDAAVKLANIQTTKVGEYGVSEASTLRLSGKVAADESRRASQVTHLPGRIEKLYVRFTGATIQKGQKIADIFSPEMVAAQRELIEAKKLESTHPELLQAAQQKLRYWKINAEQIQQIENTGIVQDVFSIYADANGVVDNRRVSVGDYVKQGAVLYDIMDLKQVWVLFDAYERDLGRFRLGDKIDFSTTALPEREFSGRINFIDPVINPETRVASLRVEVSNARTTLKPGMLVTGNLRQNIGNTGKLLIPKSAVLWTGKRSVVYVLVPETSVPSFQYREIELGNRLGSQYEVIKGLEPGEEVVTNGAFTIDASAQLNNQASMMNKTVSIDGQEPDNSLPDYSAAIPAAVKIQLEAVYTAYLSLKDVLVATDSVLAPQVAKQLLGYLKEVDVDVLDEPAKSYWSEQTRALASHLDKLNQAVKIEPQREQFSFVSNLLIEMIQVLGHGESTYYIQHCPMAFNDQGADWLSTEETIRNPYFGDKMLKCGILESVLN